MPKPKTYHMSWAYKSRIRRDFWDRVDFKNRLPAKQQDVKSIPHRKK